MKLARYVGGGEIAIVEEPMPSCPSGGLLIKTEASGLCSGELMEWYMDRKIPHVLGHEVAGKVVSSQDDRFPEGSRVFVHHHAPCLACEVCASGLHVHCTQWKSSKLEPGGMAEFFAAAKENLNDCLRVDDLRAVDAALIEPLACVMKSFRMAGVSLDCLPSRCAVIGLGVMGLMHLLLMPGGAGYDLNPQRIEHARQLELRTPEQDEPADLAIVCPGSKAALDRAIGMIQPGGTIVLFAPMPPEEETPVDLNRLYFKDVRLVNSYSCGPDDTRAALEAIRAGKIQAEQVVSDFVGIHDLPEAYKRMKSGEILKAMVVFDDARDEI